MAGYIDVIGDEIYYDRFRVGRIDGEIPPSKADSFVLTILGFDPDGDRGILEWEVDDLEGRLFDSQTEKEALESEVVALEEKVGHLENVVADLEDELSAAKGDKE